MASNPLMVCSMAKKPVWSGAHWLMLGLTIMLFGLVATLVDLKPVVDENFFFSTSDPEFRQSKKIEEHFPSRPELILTVSSGDISSPRYLGRLQKLTDQVDARRVDQTSSDAAAYREAEVGEYQVALGDAGEAERREYRADQHRGPGRKDALFA